MAETQGPATAPGAQDGTSCPACGSTNPAGNRFCGSCGSPLVLTCPACGASNPPANRFCGACGTGLTTDAPTALDTAAAGLPAIDRAPTGTPTAEAELEERKVVTVLFADLTGSTELATSMDAEDLRPVLTAYFTAMADEIERHGGTVQKFIGDAIVAVFGVPVAHEDDPERAVRAAIAMHDRLPSLNAELAATRSVELQMRIGVNTGEVVTATGIDREGLVTGTPVNLAARLEALASPGSIVVGERTHRDTRRAIAYRSLGEVAVKGFDRPMPAFEVAGVVRGTRAQGAAPMVGRDAEIDLLTLVLDRTERERKAGLATVIGPAGIGKSRLAHEFQVLARGRPTPANVVRGRCLPYGDGLTYWPLAEILRTDVGIMDSDRAGTIREKAVDRLQHRIRSDDPVSTVDVLLSSIGVPVSPDPIAGAAPEVARELIGRCWRIYFESLAAEHPVVAIVEDVHWADPSLLDLLEQLASRVAAPVLFLAMTRPDLWERRPAWGAAVRSAVRIELSPLRAEESEQLLRHLLGDATAPPEALRPVLERSEGNPFFAQELLRMLVEDGYLVRNEYDWRLDRALPSTLPDTVQGVIASRIDLLAPSEKRAIQDAAVVGRIFWVGALEALGTPDAARAVDGLVDKGLAWEREGSTIEGDRELIFNHILTRDVAYQGIPRTRRETAHMDALRWVERVTAGREEEYAEILAHHAEAAGDPAKTARYSTLAGHRSARVFAAEEAIRWYGRALEAAGRMGDAPERPTIEGEVRLGRGEAFEQLGSFPEAEPDYRAASESAEQARDRMLAARSLAALAHLHWLQDRYDDGQRVLEQALEAAREVGASNLIAKSLYTAGTIRFGRGEFREALELHQEAVRVAQEAGDLEGEAWARHGLCETVYFLGPFTEALAEGLRADELLRRIGQEPMRHHNLYMVSFAHTLMGDLEEGERTGRESLEGNRELGNRRDEAFAHNAVGQAQLHLGYLGDSVAGLDAAVAVSEHLDSPRLLFGNVLFRSLTLMEVGAYELATRDVLTALDLAATLHGTFFLPILLSGDGIRLLHEGRDDEARARFAESNETDVFLHRLERAFAGILAWEMREDPGELEHFGGELAALPDGVTPLYTSWGRYGLALAALHRGDHAAALRGLEAPLGFAEGAHARTLAWRLYRVAALAHAGLGDDAAAIDARARAVRVIRFVVEHLPEGSLRDGFRSRHDVAEVLSWAGPEA
ncbi:MAG TPA: adenylate/guanylate cyclase domain-containing protein [Actinomycetota bacterium]|nr:adenylate/guanylate cyclase domain-containing protein [Actinomycetota bacterium]